MMFVISSQQLVTVRFFFSPPINVECFEEVSAFIQGSRAWYSSVVSGYIWVIWHQLFSQNVCSIPWKTAKKSFFPASLLSALLRFHYWIGKVDTSSRTDSNIEEISTWVLVKIEIQTAKLYFWMIKIMFSLIPKWGQCLSSG